MLRCLYMKAERPFEIKKVQKIVESKETERLIECLQNLEVNATQIGEGRNAIVYVAEGAAFENVCLKKIRPKPELLANTIDQEHQFQIDAKKAGVRTPLSLVSIESDKGIYLIMERVIGPTAMQVSDDPRLAPPNFDYKTFCEALKLEIQKLHKARIYHRDLHAGNVMIDKNDGLPWIIDYGTAIISDGGDLTYNAFASVYNPLTGRYDECERNYRDDNESVKKICIGLRSTLKPNRID